jgi:hypothetical protein
MELSLRIGTKAETKKLYRRPEETTKSARHTSALQRSSLSKQVLTLETPLSAEKLLSKRPRPTVVTYPVPGENFVDRVLYVKPDQKTERGLIWINQLQYFENVPPNVWNFCLGNYYVCQKWLKIREGTTLKRQDVQDYQRLVMLIGETINLINDLDSKLVNS